GGDGKSRVLLFQGYRSRGINGLSSHASLPELRGQGHAEAAGVGGGNQLLRIGARLGFKASRERIRRTFENATGRAERAFAVFQTATPMCACCSLHVGIAPCE